MNEPKVHRQRFWLYAAIIILTACAPVEPSAGVTATTPQLATVTKDAPEARTLPEPTLAPFDLSSPAFEESGVIPDRFSCKGEDISPELNWGDPPVGTQSFALVFDDPVPGWVHWVVYNIPAEARALQEGVEDGPIIQESMMHGANSWGTMDYRGPCPPQGSTHHYVFTLYAIDIFLDLEPGADKRDLLAAMNGHIVEQAQLTADFTR